MVALEPSRSYTSRVLSSAPPLGSLFGPGRYFWQGQGGRRRHKPSVVPPVPFPQELLAVSCSQILANAHRPSLLPPPPRQETEGFEPLSWLSHESWCKSLQIFCLSSSKLLTFLRTLHVWPEIH